MNNKCIAKEPPVSIFRDLIGAFENVSNALDENANFIYSRVNTIRENSKLENESLSSSNPNSIIDQLWQQLSQFKDINYKLLLIRENLQDLVG